jgi:peroxin-12
LQVFAQRRPFAHRLLDWEDEIFGLISAILDRQSLSNHSASFADSLYGLRRAPFDVRDPTAAAKRLLNRSEQHRTLLFLVSRLFWLDAKLLSHDD